MIESVAAALIWANTIYHGLTSGQRYVVCLIQTEDISRLLFLTNLLSNGFILFSFKFLPYSNTIGVKTA